MSRILFIIIAIASCFNVSGQEKKKITAVRATQPIKIDGVLNEAAWLSAPQFNDLVEFRPSFGNKESVDSRTMAYILYDDNAVYVGAVLYEKTKDSISTELVGRDRLGINDFAGVMFDTYVDEINGVGFFVTALGEQFDCKYSLGDEDSDWSTIYHTATKISDTGWSFEMKIPYASLRFSKAEVQTWGINFVRRRTKTGQQFSWNPIDPNRFGLMNQAGRWEGITNIKSPIRLSFMPYISSYVDKAPGSSKWQSALNGGMDLKYGISKGFTLDMTLIPDFGQVQSDNQVLNLTPFEVRFNENRAFFTEGTELFNKGNLFYSRRIGGRPIHYNHVYDTNSVYPHRLPGETIIENPTETKLVNATKISGRTAGRLGIGFFNAITKPQYAIVERSNKEQYELQTDPLTNYNILVLDQALKNNSSVSLVNTNVTRNGSDYDANVTAVLWDFYDKKVDWNFWGKVGNSRLYGSKHITNSSGYNYEFNFGKFRGPFNFDVRYHIADDQYQQNDMGYFTNNNYRLTGGGAWYKWMQPRGFYNNLRVSIGAQYIQRHKPLAYQSFNFNANVNSQLRNLWHTGIVFNLRPEGQDFYEPRKWGRVFKTPGTWMTGAQISSNGAKKLSGSTSFYHRHATQLDAYFNELNFSLQYRFNDRLNVGASNHILVGSGNPGFAYIDAPTGASVFGARDQKTVEAIVNVKYNFNIRMGITFRARHYWSQVHYTSFYNLKEDGYLEPATANGNADNNVNFFNIDAVYTWQFAPGSFVNINWKDASDLFDNGSGSRYFNNLQRTLNRPGQNSFSIKVIYFLDYLSLKRS